MRKYKIRLIKFFVLLFMIITIRDLFITIKSEIGKEKLETFNLEKHSNQKSILELKSCSDLGWFNLRTKLRDYEKGLDIVFISFQYMIIPTVFENKGANKKIICYYTSPKQLDDFCQKIKKYKLIEKDIFSYFALLERID